MKKILNSFIALTLAGCMIASPALAVMKGTIDTDGKVTMFKDGQPSQQFSGKGFIEENALIVCEGNCFMHIGGTSFSAENDTAMAFKKDNNIVRLYVKNG